jgi:flagellin
MNGIISFNSNIASFAAQRRLADAGGVLRRTFEQLSSGLRINRASDDAAGLSVGAILRVQDQGIRNLNDGISLLNIRGSAVQVLEEVIFRLEELSEQSANGVLSNAQRLAIDAEGQALRDEYNRIVATVEYNGLNLFAPSLINIELQAGYGQDGVLRLPGVSEMLRGAGDGTFRMMGSNFGGGFGTGGTASDLNNDGNIDIIGATTNSINVMLGNGDGTFFAAQSYILPADRNIFLGDFNNDGLEDVVGFDGGGPVGIALGNSNGSFKARVQFNDVADTYSAALGDFNGDGNLDFATASASGSSVSVHLGNGDGTFKFRATYSNAGSGYGIATGDLNGDGILDIAAGNRIFQGNADGTFLAGVNHNLSGGANGMEIRDLDSDGRKDIIMSGPGGAAAIRVARNLGNGSYQLRNYGPSTGATSWGLAVADVNDDGILDAIAGNFTSDQFSILLGNGNATFKAGVAYSGGVNQVTTADFNNDGVIDIYGATGGNRIMFGNGTQTATLARFSLRTQEDSLEALDALKIARQRIITELGTVGASQSRIVAAIENLRQTQMNFESAASRIMDADVAETSSVLVRTSILQQSAQAVLAQANQLPELALSLLRKS